MIARLALIGFFVCCTMDALGQAHRPATDAEVEAIKKVDFIVGTWKGEGWIRMGPGAKREFSITETVLQKLGGTSLFVEGNGIDKATGKPEHQALAVITFDSKDQKYRFRTFRPGEFRDTELTLTDKGWVWGFDVPGGKIKFTMKITPEGKWNETGEMITAAGQNFQFMDMTLTKQ
jgi:hypothetical protein